MQQDIKDTNGNLVAPWQMQDKLRPGTIILVDTTLVCWHIFAKGLSKARDVRTKVTMFLDANNHLNTKGLSGPRASNPNSP